MRFALRLVQLVILIAIIIIVSRAASLPKSAQWWLISGLIWLTVWEVIIKRFLEWVAKRLFNSSIDWRWKPNGKQYAYSRGFVRLEKDGVNLGRDSCLLTILYWVLTIPVFIVGMITMVPKIALWLSTYS